MHRVPLLAESNGVLYKAGKVTTLDSGKGVMVYAWGTKISRHANGKVYAGPVGSGEAREVSLEVPSSDITTEEIHRTAIPSDLTFRLEPYDGQHAESAFVFPESALLSNSSFAVQIVSNILTEQTLNAWRQYPATISAQSVIDKTHNQSVILTVLEPERY